MLGHVSYSGMRLVGPGCVSGQDTLLRVSKYQSCVLFIVAEYSCPSVCRCVCLSVCLCVCVSVFVHDNSKNNGSMHLKLEHIVVYENSSDEFDIGHCPIKVKVTAWLWTFSPFTTIQTVRSYISALAQVRKLWLSMYVYQIIIYKI